MVDPLRPFVLHAATGQKRGEYAGLLEAIAAQKDDDIIRIHGNGPFVVDTVRSQRGLNLQAAPGYRPRFVWAVNASGHWFELRGKVLIDGCDFLALRDGA